MASNGTERLACTIAAAGGGNRHKGWPAGAAATGQVGQPKLGQAPVLLRAIDSRLLAGAGAAAGAQDKGGLEAGLTGGRAVGTCKLPRSRCTAAASDVRSAAGAGRRSTPRQLDPSRPAFFIKTGGRLLQGPQILLAATTMSPALVQAAAAPAVAVAGRPAAVGGRSAAAGAPLRPAARSAARQQRRRGGSVQAVASPVKPAAGAKAGGKAAISAEEAHKLYHDMVLGREFEEMCAQMYYRGKMFGFVHLYSGQEAVSTGAPCPPPLCSLSSCCL